MFQRTPWKPLKNWREKEDGGDSGATAICGSSWRKEWERREREFLREQMECSMEEEMEEIATTPKQAPNGAQFLWEDPDFIGVEGETVLVDMNRSIGDVMMLRCV